MTGCEDNEATVQFDLGLTITDSSALTITDSMVDANQPLLVNECAEGTDDCHGDATCRDLADGFACSCNPGFSGDGVNCSPVLCDPAVPNSCDTRAKCEKIADSFMCVCDAGYALDGTTCVNANECTNGGHDCHALAQCTDTEGSFTCACRPGYEGDGKSCVDLDECAQNNGGCDSLTTCTNIAGSRTCGSCPQGYSGTGEDGCTAIDPCATNNGGCDPLTTCTETGFAVTCGDCPAGYAGTGLNGCAAPVVKVTSVTLNGLELTQQIAVPTSSVNLSANNQLCFTASQSGKYFYQLVLHIKGMTYRAAVGLLGEGTQFCKTFLLPAEQMSTMELFLQSNYNVEITREAPSGLIADRETVFGMSFVGRAYQLEGSTLYVPLLTMQDGVKIFSNCGAGHKVLAESVVNDSPNPEVTRAIYLYDQDAWYDDPTTAIPKPFPIDSVGRAYLSNRTVVIKSKKDLISDYERILLKGVVMHEMFHVRTNAVIPECGGLDAAVLSLDPGGDPRFFGSAQPDKYSFAKLVGGYPTYYAMTNCHEYISEAGKIVYTVFLQGEAVAFQNISPNLVANINFLNGRGYFLPTVLLSVNASPSAVLPPTSAFRVFSADFPASDFAAIPTNVFPQNIKIDGQLVYANGVQVMTHLPYAETFALCVDQQPDLVPGEFFSIGYEFCLLNETHCFSTNSPFVMDGTGYYCGTISKHPAMQTVKGIRIATAKRIVDTTQFFSATRLKGGSVEVSLTVGP